MKENVSRTVMSDSVTPWTTVHQAQSFREILQARILEWVAIPVFPEDLPNLGIEPTSLTSPALTGGFFTTVPLYVTFGQK